MGAEVTRHRTALLRTELSRPLRTVIADGLLPARMTLMDYGCGRGDDVRFLKERGYDCSGWDPVHAPNGQRREADVVNLGYVVNVIEDPSERREVLHTSWSLARRILVHSSGIEGLIFWLVGCAIRREAFLRRSSGRAWPWWR
jgi:DNA phosphorothioation-associated putative methyltransferase